MTALRYHWNIELMASPSSALLSLLMQQVSTHTNSRPFRHACAQVPFIFWKPVLPSHLDRLLNCAKVTSSWSYVCDRIAYAGGFAGNQLRAKVSQLIYRGPNSRPHGSSYILVYRTTGIF